VIWEIYLFLLGGCAGAVYTLSMVASGHYFRGTGLLRVAGLIGLAWNISSSLGPAATGLLMQHFGSAAMVAVLWAMSLVFVLLTFKGNAAIETE
jgi:MFS family permease